MSEKDNNEPRDAGDTSGDATSAGESAVPIPAVEATPAAKATARPSGAGGAAPGNPPPARSGSAFPGWLALLLVLALAGGLVWVLLQAQQREHTLLQRLDALESRSGGASEAISASETRLRDDMTRAASASAAEREAQSAKIEALSRKLESQAQMLDRFSATDEDSWLRAEAQYLLRLANQRVLMARDPGSALALLQSADGILHDLDDPALYDARAAVAAEIADLRAVPVVDVEGIYLRLSALIDQAGKLKIFQMPEAPVHDTAPENAESWQVRLRRGYEQALQKLSDFIVIRRRDVPMQALMDPQWEGLVRQNLRMLLEQAQVALLSGNQTLYGASLERARHWVAQFAETDTAAARAMDEELVALQQQTIEVNMPDLSRSLRALDAAIRQPQPKPRQPEPQPQLQPEGVN